MQEKEGVAMVALLDKIFDGFFPSKSKEVVTKSPELTFAEEAVHKLFPEKSVDDFFADGALEELRKNFSGITPLWGYLEMKNLEAGTTHALYFYCVSSKGTSTEMPNEEVFDLGEDEMMAKVRTFFDRYILLPRQELISGEIVNSKIEARWRIIAIPEVLTDLLMVPILVADSINKRGETVNARRIVSPKEFKRIECVLSNTAETFEEVEITPFAVRKFDTVWLTREGILVHDNRNLGERFGAPECFLRDEYAPETDAEEIALHHTVTAFREGEIDKFRTGLQAICGDPWLPFTVLLAEDSEIELRKAYRNRTWNPRDFDFEQMLASRYIAIK